MPAKTVKTKSIDLGKLQDQFELADKEYRSAEKALARGQEDRDTKKARLAAADSALQAAVRSVRG